MSCTEIYGFDLKGDVILLGEVKNAFRGAIAIWDIINQRYLNGNNMVDDKICSIFDLKLLQKIWDLGEDETIPETDRIVLRSTFDKVVVFTKDIPKVVQAFNDFDGGTTLREQAKIIDENKEGLLGICWNQTSVNHGVWDDYNLLTMTDHWDLFKPN